MRTGLLVTAAVVLIVAVVGTAVLVVRELNQQPGSSPASDTTIVQPALPPLPPLPEQEPASAALPGPAESTVNPDDKPREQRALQPESQPPAIVRSPGRYANYYNIERNNMIEADIIADKEDFSSNVFRAVRKHVFEPIAKRPPTTPEIASKCQSYYRYILEGLQMVQIVKEHMKDARFPRANAWFNVKAGNARLIDASLRMECAAYYIANRLPAGLFAIGQMHLSSGTKVKLEHQAWLYEMMAIYGAYVCIYHSDIESSPVKKTILYIASEGIGKSLDLVTASYLQPGRNKEIAPLVNEIAKIQTGEILGAQVICTETDG